MHKIYVIALREYRAAVRSKAFVITLVVMPILMGGAIVAQLLLKDQGDTSDKRFAIVDRSGEFREVLEGAAKEYNERGVFKGEGEEKKKVEPAFILEFLTPEQVGEPPESTLLLSERVRKKEIYGFLEIGGDVVDGKGKFRVTYHSLTPVDSSFRQWVGRKLNEEIQRIRGRREGLDAAAVQRIVQPVQVEDKGLVTRDEETGEISEPKDTNIIAHIFLPMGLMMLIFMSVMVGATPLMQAVMEEKQARISEVLLGSVQPFQLMMGKLAGIVAVTLTTVMVYIVGAYFTLDYLEYGHLFPPADVVVWLIVFQTLAVLMYGSLFIAIGAAVSDMREAQSAMMPVMIFAMAPMFVWIYVVKEPDATMSVVLSLLPPATPMLMLLRLAVPSGVPLWQPVLGVVLVALSTVGCVYTAGRIFRVGVLMQGKGASIKQMAAWVIRG